MRLKWRATGWWLLLELGWCVGADAGYTNTLAQTRAWLTNAMAAQDVRGLAVALVDGTNTVWVEGFGWADEPAGMPVTTATVFRVGSVSKVFTAALALQLSDQGRLDLDAPASNYFPGLTWQTRYPDAGPITVRQLLNFHCGLPGDLLNGGFTTVPFADYLATLTNYLAATYPVYPPDFIQNYCNAAFVLMERIIAEADGRSLSFAAIAESNLFSRLGMAGSSFQKDKSDIAHFLARPCMGGTWMPEEFANLYGTGGLYSRPGDLADFLKVMLNTGLSVRGEAILQPASITEMLRIYGTNLPLDAFMEMKPGLGWDTVQDPQLEYAGRNAYKTGATLTESGMIEILPDQGLGVAVAANNTSPLTWDAAPYILKLAVAEKNGLAVPTNMVFFPAATQAVDQAELDLLAGVYVRNQGYAAIESQPGSLTVVLNAHTAAPHPVSGLVRRVSGWFSKGANPISEILFTNVAGRRIAVMRNAVDYYVVTNLFGEKHDPPPLSAAWSNRIGRTWFVSDENVRSYLSLIGGGPQLTLTNQNGVLMAVGGCCGYKVLSPTNDRLAFVPGLNNRGDSAFQVVSNAAEGEFIRFFGFHFKPAPDVLEWDRAVEDVIQTPAWCGWSELRPQVQTPALRYEVVADGLPTNFILRLIGADGLTELAVLEGPGRFQFEAPEAPLYLRVQPDIIGPQTGQYGYAWNYPVMIHALARDFGGDVITWQGWTGAVYRLAVADQLGAFVSVATTAPAAAWTISATNPGLSGALRYYRVERLE